MKGRESQRANDPFCTCSFIEYMARSTRNRATDVFDALGETRVLRILDLTDIYHSDNIEAVSEYEAMKRTHHSPVTALINVYNGSFYYESPQAIYAAYATGEIE